MRVRFFRGLGLTVLCAIALFGLWVSIWVTPAWAGVDDDNYDGNIVKAGQADLALLLR